METWSKCTMEDAGLNYDFIQDNHSYSATKGVLRGLHLQLGESAQAKLVRCTKGTVFDVVADLRTGSPTFKQWFRVELSAENKRQLLIPRGFAHGFLTMTDDVEFEYKVDNYYNQSAERTILWCDPELAVDWGVDNPILSEKDRMAPLLSELELEIDFVYLRKNN